MSSSSPEIPVESGSYSDMKAWDVNAVAEPIMRIWQLSEALSRMSRRIQKRYPKEARILKTASEDVIYSFYQDIKEKQDEYLKNAKSSELSSAKDLDAARYRREIDRQESAPRGKGRRSFSNV